MASSQGSSIPRVPRCERNSWTVLSVGMRGDFLPSRPSSHPRARTTGHRFGPRIPWRANFPGLGASGTAKPWAPCFGRDSVRNRDFGGGVCPPDATFVPWSANRPGLPCGAGLAHRPDHGGRAGGNRRRHVGTGRGGGSGRARAGHASDGRAVGDLGCGGGSVEDPVFDGGQVERLRGQLAETPALGAEVGFRFRLGDALLNSGMNLQALAEYAEVERLSAGAGTAVTGFSTG